MRELTHLDLFSGIGGFALAAKRAGFRTVGFSEIDSFASRVLAERFPGVANFGDVRNARAFSGLGPITVLTAGYPCQPASLAGKRGGAGDHRWLWPAVRDILPIVRPTWFIGENVLGHVSLGLDEVLADLESHGYSAQPFTIPACAVGAWHRRERVWIVAHLDGDWEQQPQGRIAQIGGRTEHGSQGPAADTDGEQLRQQSEPEPRGGGAAVTDGDLQDAADVDRSVRERRADEPERRQEGRAATDRTLEGNDADTARLGCEGRDLQEAPGRSESADVPADAARCRLEASAGEQARESQLGLCAAGGGGASDGSGWDAFEQRYFEWPAEPPLVRVVHGIPNRAHRIKALGNAIVPQVAEPFFHWIAAIERGEIT